MSDSVHRMPTAAEAVIDRQVRARLAAIIGWHVNRQHVNLSDHELAMVGYREYSKHVGRALIDPNE